MEHNHGVTPAGPGCQPTASAPSGSSQNGIPCAEMRELAERCEQATGPDRKLDVWIAVALDWRWDDWEEGESTARGQAEKHGIDWLIGRATEGIASMWRHMPHFTSSIDAAATLVPDWHDWLINTGRDYAHVWEQERIGEKSYEARARTPALALCAAALKASAAIAGETGTAGPVSRPSPKGEHAGRRHRTKEVYLMRDDVISRVRFDAIKRAEISIMRGGDVLQIDKADLRELLSLARGNRDAFTDALAIEEELAGDVPVTRETWLRWYFT